MGTTIPVADNPTTTTPDRSRDTVARLAYSIDEVLAAVPIGRTALYGEIAAGRLRTVKVGRRRLVPCSALDAWIERGAADV